VSIVRVGLAETKKFAEGYEAIFGRKGTQAKKQPAKKTTAARRKKATKKR